MFWILTGSCITVYCAVLPFNNIASGFVVEKWLLPYNNATHSYTPESQLVGILPPPPWCAGERTYPCNVCCACAVVLQPTSQQNSLDAKANSIMLITYLTAGCISPLLGGVIDRVGHRAHLNVVSAALVILVHFLLRNTQLYPVFPLLLLGFW